MPQTRRLPERPIPGRRLGRHISFDDRSRAYRVSPPTQKIVTRRWMRTTPPFDQGNLGSCTGNGAAGLLATQPFASATAIDEALAVQIYERATRDDDIEGVYPPDDTGSTVLAAMKALKDMALVDEYHWCFGLEDVLLTLSQLGPVEVGVSWYEGFDTPDNSGLVKVEGQVRGGHAFEVLEVDAEAKRVVAINSWGTAWGKAGRFTFSWDDLERLLNEQGEAATIAARGA